ncbi:zinc finger (CCCH-type) family protein [Actinidia rufa]|uniref:Zinc finger (CCCH-type) family protein n=1 Tax=Actinidia rufa TaxID=165716 RepID=A0A7J0HCX6_9ERIC|nr:zinc finger (CCCH-type) family protein [Actinidia rufa]
MNFSDHLTPPFPGGDGFWPSDEDPENPNFDFAPPLKRPRNFGINQPNSGINNIPNPPMNRGTGHIFYKTRMCLKFVEGNCRNGEYCTFAHGPEELRKPPPNWQEIVAEKDKVIGIGNWSDDQRMIQKMKICKKFFNGEECPYGEKCNFLHVDPRESSAISIGTMGQKTGSGPDQCDGNRSGSFGSDLDRFRGNAKGTYWKTKLCSKWETTGQCPFGERCHFAHGLSELQLPGGRIEAEVVDALTIPTKPVSVPVNDVAPSKAVVAAPAKEDGDGKKGFSKWKGPKKINRIYADWIDDLTPPHNLPSIVES